ncbi:MAG: HEPN domain-containing protein [Deferrisomatales bacterium]|nr:HEPN domain-containing protein [Deferrisomatales bacterium]
MECMATRWSEQAAYDLETAAAMYSTGRWLYVLFCCQQAVEKMLKSLIVLRTQETPPRLHNLMRLAARAGLEVDESRAESFRLLAAYYIETRYPEELGSLAAAATEPLARETLEQTREVIAWLKSLSG